MTIPSLFGSNSDGHLGTWAPGHLRAWKLEVMLGMHVLDEVGRSLPSCFKFPTIGCIGCISYLYHVSAGNRDKSSLIFGFLRKVIGGVDRCWQFV